MHRLICGLVVLGILLAGCSKSGTESGGDPEVFIFARGADAQKLDPADVDDGESVNTMAQIFEGLLGFKPASLEVEPRLAESYQISADGLTYTFKIREGIRFHDGVPLNAETAAFSFLRQLDPKHPAHLSDASFQYWSLLFSAVEAVRVVDEMTLEFGLSRADAAMVSAFASFPAWLISPGAFETYGEAMASHPIGTGPYRFVSWKPNQAVIFERNNDYWSESKAGFQRLVMRSIPLNATRLSELKSGQIDGLDGLQPSELSGLDQDPHFVVHHRPGVNVGYLAFSGFSQPLESPDVRRAIAMAIDREALVELALNGYGSVADYPLPPGFLGIPSETLRLRHDPEAAKSIISNHPEVTARPIQLATFTEPRLYFPDPARIASLIRSDLEAIGLKVEIVTREFKSHLHFTRRGEFDMALLGWMADTPDTSNFLDTFLHSRSAVMGSATNISFYRNPEMDQLLEDALRVSDPEERARFYGEALGLWERDLPLIPLVHGDQIAVMRKEIVGYELHPSGNHFFGPVFWREPVN